MICALLVAETRSEECRRRDFMRPGNDRQHLTTCMLSAMVSALIDRHPFSTIGGSSAELPRITWMSCIDCMRYIKIFNNCFVSLLRLKMVASIVNVARGVAKVGFGNNIGGSRDKINDSLVVLDRESRSLLERMYSKVDSGLIRVTH